MCAEEEKEIFKLVEQSVQFLRILSGKLVRRGYQSHLADFLLRINFNNFYNAE